MKILTTALYSFIIEVLWILNTVRYNWSLSYTHRNTHHHHHCLGSLFKPSHFIQTFRPLDCSSIEWNNCVYTMEYCSMYWSEVFGLTVRVSTMRDERERDVDTELTISVDETIIRW